MYAMQMNDELRNSIFEGRTVLTDSWSDVEYTLFIRALHNGGYDTIKVLSVTEEVDDDGRTVYDVYTATIEMYIDESRKLSDKESVNAVIQEFVNNEKYVKEYRTVKGLQNFVQAQAQANKYDVIKSDFQ